MHLLRGAPGARMTDQHLTRNTFEVGTCTGKARFDSAKLAHLVQRRGHKVRQVYRCRHCGGWHLGSNSAREMRWPKPERAERGAEDG